MKTIAQQLNIKKFPFSIKDEYGKEIYHENLDGFWRKSEYDSNGNEIFYENSNGIWAKYKYDNRRNIIFYETSSNYWVKYEYDSMGNLIYLETVYGIITDHRPKPCEGKVVEIDGVKYKLTKA